MRVLAECRVDEANRILAVSNTLFVDTVDDRREDWSAGGSAFERGVAIDVSRDVVAIGGYAGVATADAVVETAIHGDAAAEVGVVVGIRRHVFGEEVINSILLVIRNRVNVAEATSG